MATYLCVKVNNTTKKFTAKESKEAGKPYLRVPGGYFPLTTETTTGIQLKVRANNTNYRIVETYKTTINTTTNTTTTVQAQSSSSVTTSETGSFYKTQVHIFNRAAYKVSFTKGESITSIYDNYRIIIHGSVRDSQFSNTASTFAATASRAYFQATSQTITKTGVIYINNSNIQEGFCVEMDYNNPFISTYNEIIGFIISSEQSASIMNMTYMSRYTKNNTTWKSNGWYFNPNFSRYYGNFGIINVRLPSITGVMMNIFNPADVVISTENYTYETTSNTVVNTTIETTSQ